MLVDPIRPVCAAVTDNALTSQEVLVDNALPLSSPRLNQLFEAQVKAAPQAIALLHNGRSLTYLELDRRANQLAHHLRTLGAGPERTVGVCLPRAFDMIIAIFAILKAGAAYVPLDPRTPVQRLAYMLQDSGAIILITPTPLINNLAFSGVVLDLDARAEIIARASQDQPGPLGNGSSLAYIIYTSGSTGIPKGVMLTHSATNLVAWARQSFSREDLACVAATTSLGFDPSVLEIFVPLCLGGSVIIKDNALQPFSDDEHPTMLLGSPSVLSQLAADGHIPDSVRVINVGGEIVRNALVQRLYSASKVQRIYNHYGPTEATTCATVALISRTMLSDPPIGRPVCGCDIYVLNSDGQIVGDGEAGEIHIAGENLAWGYRNQPGLTRSSFIPNPFDPLGGQMYRTGDLGRWSDSGDLEFLGRIDDQVKLSGIRVELGEIETALLRIEGVRQAAIAVTNDAAGLPRLVAYLETDEPPVPAEIRQALGAWLLPVMVPPSYIFLKKFPLTVSGKIDRATLFEVKQPHPSTEPPLVKQSVFSLMSRRLEARLQGRTHRISSVEAATALAVQKAWRRTLPDSPLDPGLSWTDAGGDSLGMLQLLLKLEQALDRKLGFDLLSYEMTQSDLTDRLLQVESAIKSNASFPVMHLVPGIMGDDPALASFRRAFDGIVRFELIEPPELKEDGAILRSLAETGRRVAREIQKRQPMGSILLAGYSIGGAVVFEAARQILEDGRRVALLLVLDTRIDPKPGDGIAKRSAATTAFYSWLKRLLQILAGTDITRQALFSPGLLLGHQRRLDFRRLVLRHFRFEAHKSWRPVALSVPAVIVLSETFGPLNRSHWIRLLPKGSFVDVPGSHNEIFDSRALAWFKPAVLEFISGTNSNRSAT